VAQQLTPSALARRTPSKKGLILEWVGHLPHPTKEIRPHIYFTSSHHFHLIARRLMPKFPIFLVKLTVWQRKLDLDFKKQDKNMLINIDVQQTLTQNIYPPHSC
jgi:hypothetical protein